MKSGDGTWQVGMSLRDYFAGQALCGLITQYAYSERESTIISDMAYEYADAMLEERSKE